jgi:kanamycin nucleotidyltransferase
MNNTGPQPKTHDERLKLANDIAQQFHECYGKKVKAIGIYGSLARNTDTEYSDIEMYCVIKGKKIDTPYEWSGGDWKAEVNVQSADVLLEWASEFDETWSLTHGSCVNILPIYDPENFFPTLKDKVFDHSDEEFDSVIKAMIIGELYEFLGKIRNAYSTGNTASLPMQVINITKFGAFMIGLANRFLYTSSSSFFAESLTLPNRPNGYDALCEIVMNGELNDFPRITQAANTFWDGVESWAKSCGLRIHDNLDELLK